LAHVLEGLLGRIAEFPAMVQFLISAVLAALTEEWSTVAVFGLARVGKVAWPVAVGSVFLGTFTINIALWWAGRVAGIRALRWKMFSRFPADKLEKLRHHVQREGWIAVAASRFVPGTRIPVFVLSGVLGMGFRAYVLTQFVANVVWILATLGLVHVVVGLAQDDPWLLAGIVAVLVLAGTIAWRLRRRKAT
jgi:membrane protein DedA with SNARE-associated domain